MLGPLSVRVTWVTTALCQKGMLFGNNSRLPPPRSTRGYRPMADMRTVAAATSLVFTLGLVCFAQPGFAQQPDSSPSAEALKKLSIEQLMNLQVTSVSKRPERLSQTASADRKSTRLNS